MPADGKDDPPRPFSISNFEPDIGRRDCDRFSRQHVFAGIFFQIEILRREVGAVKGEECATNDTMGTNPAGPQWL